MLDGRGNPFVEGQATVIYYIRKKDEELPEELKEVKRKTG